MKIKKLIEKWRIKNAASNYKINLELARSFVSDKKRHGWKEREMIFHHMTFPKASHTKKCRSLDLWFNVRVTTLSFQSRPMDSSPSSAASSHSFSFSFYIYLYMYTILRNRIREFRGWFRRAGGSTNHWKKSSAYLFARSLSKRKDKNQTLLDSTKSRYFFPAQK